MRKKETKEPRLLRIGRIRRKRKQEEKGNGERVSVLRWDPRKQTKGKILYTTCTGKGLHTRIVSANLKL